MPFFAYVHAKPESKTQQGIFYVGKGKGQRHLSLNARNRHHGFVVSKHGRENILIGKIDCSSEKLAFELEKGLIKCLRRNGVDLTNMTDGGDGSSGYVASEETKRRQSASAKLLAARPEVKSARSKKSTENNLKRWADPEFKAKASAAMKGKKKTLTPTALEARRKNFAKAHEKRKISAKAT